MSGYNFKLKIFLLNITYDFEFFFSPEYKELEILFLIPN